MNQVQKYVLIDFHLKLNTYDKKRKICKCIFRWIFCSITSKVTGSTILFRGIRTSSGDQSANLKSLSGVTTWILDEAEELMDEETFDKINLSIRQKGKQNRVILLLNPSTKAH